MLICIRCHDYSRQDIFLGLLLYFLIPCHLFAAYLIELAAAQQARGSRKRIKAGSDHPSEEDRKAFHTTWVMVAWAHGINITLALAIATLVVYVKIHHPLIGTLTELHAVIVWLKTASYAFTNRDLRHAYLYPVEGEVPELYKDCPYPQNITMGNLVYFWWAPTLVYQPVYPRTDKIRWLFVLKRLGEIFCLSVFIWFATAQYATPVLVNSLDKIASLDIPSILERLMKLSTISLVIWLAGFFALFQSFLNALAEVLRFGDRSFYDDWWNSESLGAYWRTWNKPVYTYFKRHIYMPMVGRGWSPPFASLCVFFMSAVLHEILVGVPTHNIIGESLLLPYIEECGQISNMYPRRRVLRHVPPAALNIPYSTAGKDEARSGREDNWQHHLLGIFHRLRPALCRSHVLLRLAGEVRECEQAHHVIGSATFLDDSLDFEHPTSPEGYN